MNYTPAEQKAWGDHFTKYPYGDFYTHKLLADILCLIAKVLGGKELHPRTFAPWMYKDSDTEKVIEEPTPEEDIRMKSLQQIVDLKHGS